MKSIEAFYRLLLYHSTVVELSQLTTATFQFISLFVEAARNIESSETTSNNLPYTLEPRS